MLTEHIELPDPVLYRRVHLVLDDMGNVVPPRPSVWQVKIGVVGDEFMKGNQRRKLVFEHEDRTIARAVFVEMKIRMGVARRLLGLEP